MQALLQWKPEHFVEFDKKHNQDEDTPIRMLLAGHFSQQDGARC